MKHAFTLVELIAVIVIMAIIGVITTKVSVDVYQIQRETQILQELEARASGVLQTLAGQMRNAVPQSVRLREAILMPADSISGGKYNIGAQANFLGKLKNCAQGGCEYLHNLEMQLAEGQSYQAIEMANKYTAFGREIASAVDTRCVMNLIKHLPYFYSQAFWDDIVRDQEALEAASGKTLLKNPCFIPARYLLKNDNSVGSDASDLRYGVGGVRVNYPDQTYSPHDVADRARYAFVCFAPKLPTGVAKTGDGGGLFDPRKDNCNARLLNPVFFTQDMGAPYLDIEAISEDFDDNGPEPLIESSFDTDFAYNKSIDVAADEEGEQAAAADGKIDPSLRGTVDAARAKLSQNVRGYKYSPWFGIHFRGENIANSSQFLEKDVYPARLALNRSSEPNGLTDIFQDASNWSGWEIFLDLSKNNFAISNAFDIISGVTLFEVHGHKLYMVSLPYSAYIKAPFASANGVADGDYKTHALRYSDARLEDNPYWASDHDDCVVSPGGTTCYDESGANALNSRVLNSAAMMHLRYKSANAALLTSGLEELKIVDQNGVRMVHICLQEERPAFSIAGVQISGVDTVRVCKSEVI